jgi:hypothetical protein
LVSILAVVLITLITPITLITQNSVANIATFYDKACSLYIFLCEKFAQSKKNVNFAAATHIILMCAAAAAPAATGKTNHQQTNKQPKT